MRRRARLAAACLAGLACASPPLGIDLGGWHEVRLPRVVVLGNVQTDTLQELATELATFHALVLKATNARIEQSVVPVRLYVFGDASQAEAFVGAAAGVMMPRLSGYSGYLGDDRGFYSTRHVLFHEYAHAVLRAGRRTPYPRWYDEGLCEFLATTRFRDDTAIIGTTLAGRVRSLVRWGILPLEDLFDPERHERSHVGRFYGTAWALVHYLNGSQEGRERLVTYARRLAQGEPWRDAYAASFDRHLPVLQAELEDHVARLTRGLVPDFYLPLDDLEVPETPAADPVAPAEIGYRLSGGLRWRFEHVDEAASLRTMRILLERALEEDPSHARARAALAWAYARSGDEERAMATLARAQAEAPDDAVVALEAGRFWMRRAADSGHPLEQAAAARTALERAVRLGPDLPDAHAAYARLLRVMDEPQLAIASFERARELGAWSPELDLDLARAYLDTGSRERAVALLQLVAADDHGGETAEQARDLLAEIGDRVASEADAPDLSPRRPPR